MAQLVGDVELPGGELVSYTVFIAPGMLAASAMNGATYDAVFNLFFKLKYNKLYDAVLATPVTPVDVAVGEIGWALMRGAFYSSTFLLVMLRDGADLVLVGAARAARRACWSASRSRLSGRRRRRT